MVLKAETSSGSTLSHLLYGYDSNQTTVSGLGVATWTSLEIALPENASVVNFTANGVGIDAASTLKLQIFVDGVLKKEEVERAQFCPFALTTTSDNIIVLAGSDLHCHGFGTYCCFGNKFFFI